MKRFLGTLLVLICLFALSSCASKPAINNESSNSAAASGSAQPSASTPDITKTEVEPIFKSLGDEPNFSCDLHITQSGQTSIFHYDVCEDGFRMTMAGSGGYDNWKEQKSAQWIEGVNMVFLHDYVESSAQTVKDNFTFSGGTLSSGNVTLKEKIVYEGRNTTVYSANLGVTEATYLIDDEYGFVMQLIYSNGTAFEIHNLSLGTVTDEIFQYPEGYAITED